MAMSITEKALNDIAKDLHQINKVLERMSQAPLFMKQDIIPSSNSTIEKIETDKVKYPIEDTTIEAIYSMNRLLTECTCKKCGYSFDLPASCGSDQVPKYCAGCGRKIVTIFSQ